MSLYRPALGAGAAEPLPHETRRLDEPRSSVPEVLDASAVIKAQVGYIIRA